MKKIIVIGCPGSGKSHFSKQLHKKTQLPLYHLDMIFWNEDKTTVEKSVFIDKLYEILKKDEWIIDGNYASTMELRIKECDTIVFLDMNVDVCLLGVQSRKGQSRSDLPWTETEEDTEFSDFIKNFNRDIRPQIIKLLEKYSNKNIFVFKDRAETQKFLNFF